MNDTKSKIISEFCLMPESKARLQAFFDERFEDLRSEDKAISHKALRDLAEVMVGAKPGSKEAFDLKGDGALPREVLQELQNVLAGKSEYAFVIRNCPERDHKDMLYPRPQDSYSYFIGRAIYEMWDDHYITTSKAYRQSQHNSNEVPVGMMIHRDTLTEKRSEHENPNVPRGEYVTFVCPHNAENAVIEIIKLKEAIESLSEEQRQKIQVHALFGKKTQKIMTLAEVLEEVKPIKNTLQSGKPLFQGINIIDDAYDVDALTDAISNNATTKNLQPGDVMVVNENTTYHMAHFGDEMMIHKIPKTQKFSRILYHISGAPGDHSRL